MTLEKNKLQKTESSSLELIFDVTRILVVLEIKGEDRINFVGNLITADIKSFKPYQGQETLILNAKAVIEFQLWVFAFPEKIILVVPSSDRESLKEFIEKRLFMEDVTINSIISSCYYFEKPTKKNPTLSPWSAYEGEGKFWLRLDCTGEEGYLTWGDWGINDHPHPLHHLNLFLLKTYEVSPHLGDNFPRRVAAMELPQWERFFSFDKGCYPGQEIIARSRSRQQTPARRYVLLGWYSIDSKNSKSQKTLPPDFSKYLQPNTTIKFKETRILGEVISSQYNPDKSLWISWCHIHRDFALPGQRIPITLQIGNPESFKKSIQLEIEVKSTIKINKQNFHKSMEEGLNAYHNSDYLKAQEHFTHATTLNPDGSDAWEALAMIEEKKGNLEEAIRLNKIFAEKNSDSPLARTNLSRLYMQKGWIEKAEEEKSKATVLMFKAAAREKKLKEEQVKTTTLEDKKSNRKRKKIFKQVLEMDPHDEIAHFGLGKLLFEEKDYEKAEKHLRIVLAQNPTYSLGYSFLAECLVKKSQFEEAQSILREGIHQAKKQGQMIPLKSMEESLYRLSDKIKRDKQ